jgi:hypothetical protein
MPSSITAIGVNTPPQLWANNRKCCLKHQSKFHHLTSTSVQTADCRWFAPKQLPRWNVAACLWRNNRTWVDTKSMEIQEDGKGNFRIKLD